MAVKNFLENCKQEKITKEDLIIFLQEKFERFKEFKNNSINQFKIIRFLKKQLILDLLIQESTFA